MSLQITNRDYTRLAEIASAAAAELGDGVVIPVPTGELQIQALLKVLASRATALDGTHKTSTAARDMYGGLLKVCYLYRGRVDDNYVDMQGHIAAYQRAQAQAHAQAVACDESACRLKVLSRRLRDVFETIKHRCDIPHESQVVHRALHLIELALPSNEDDVEAWVHIANALADIYYKATGGVINTGRTNSVIPVIRLSDDDQKLVTEAWRSAWKIVSIIEPEHWLPREMYR